MEGLQQQRYYDLGKTYWWLAGKYRIIEDVIARRLDAATAGRRLLDLGCGPGNMLDFLGPFGEIYGSDYSADALRFCQQRRYERLFRADFHRLPVKADAFDLVTCIDVLEHLEHDERAMVELQRVLRPGGLLVATVPAYMSLWGDHDELYGHYRRYRAGEFRSRLAAAGFEVLKVSYFEPLFFVPLYLYRKWKRLAPRPGGIEARDDFVKLPDLVNTALTHLIAGERFLLRVLDIPFGVTLLAVARKPA